MQMLRLVCRCGVLRERTRSVTFSGFVGSAGLLPRAQGDRLALIFSSTMLKSFCARNKFRPRATGMEEKQQSAPWKRSAGWRHTRAFLTPSGETRVTIDPPPFRNCTPLKCSVYRLQAHIPR